METPWKVIGFEKFTSEKGEECVRLYVARTLAVAEGHAGEGLETNRLFFKPQYVKYTPVVGHRIIALDGRYGLSQIYVLGDEAPANG